MAPTKLSNKTKRKRKRNACGGSSGNGSGRSTSNRNLTVQLLLCLGGIVFFATNQILQSRSVAVSVTSTTGGGEDHHPEMLAEVLKNQKLLKEENQKLQKELQELKQQKGISTISNGPPPPPFDKETSIFTPHIEQILEIIKTTTLNKPGEWNQKPGDWPYHPQMFCPQAYSIYVDKPYSPPSAIECRSEGTWCALLLNLFAPRKHPTKPGEVVASTAQNHLRTLPYNVSFGISSADMVKVGTMAYGNCLGSSGPNGGQFSMNNFHHAKAMFYALNANPDSTNNNNNPPPPPPPPGGAPKWEDRNKIPIFRGHSRMMDRWQPTIPNNCPTNGHVTNGAFGQAYRPRAVLFSLEHPDLLDARITDHWHSCMWMNATNGMDRLYGFGEYATKTGSPDSNKIPPDRYYNRYQVAVVLGGVGAAFRTSTHLRAGQAIVLQRFAYEEWFVPYMKPYTHYIPLREDLSDLETQLEWVRDNPTRVQQIARAGQRFYQQWISHEVTWQHWHELLYRLSETLNGPQNQNMSDAKTKERTSKGTARQVWPAPIMPLRYIRDPNNPTGPFVLEDYETTRIPYWEVDGPPESREMCKKNPIPAKDSPNIGWCK